MEHILKRLLRSVPLAEMQVLFDPFVDQMSGGAAGDSNTMPVLPRDYAHPLEPLLART